MDKFNEDQEFLYLKIKSELTDSTDKRVSEHLDRDRTLIKNTITTVSRVFLWVIALFSVLLTILGIKTYSDIKNAINKTAETSISRELAKTDILKKYENKAKILYTNALTESYLLKLEKLKHNRFSRFELKPEHLEHFIDVIDRPDLDIDTFKSIISILSEARFEPNEKERLMAKLKVILSKDFIFYSYNTEKLTAIFTNLHNIDYDEFKIINRHYIKDSEENLEVRIAAINHLKKTSDYEAIPLLEDLSSSKNEDIQKASLNALAYCNCKNKKVQHYIAKKLTGKINLDKASDLLNIVNESLSGIYSSNKRKSILDEIDEDTLESCLEQSKELVKKLIDKGVMFTYSKFAFSDRPPRLSIYLKNRKSILSSINGDLFFKYHIEQKLLSDATNSLETFSKYLKGLNSINSLVRREQEARIIATINSDKILKLNDTELSSKDINGNIVIELNDNDKVMAKWWDYSDKLIVKEIKELNALEEFRFISRASSSLNELWWK
ncbi:HEAT repeat domain-containing protein [Flavivirga eckloniae]|uniref:HEAT repeat domain-containing protein n=1 Tax=Flavivirga eckloniae TaxID=1803846 RepID=A0A2K9PRR6_9FLAO|nr:HEAT repeat domain-containing protein [Flavivirga eckloniae]AUP79488.1 hypothetical protein C1H87_12530 [Flavivirga eckloniae]